MARRRAKEGEGVRSRVGERINPGPVSPIDTYEVFSCPACDSRVRADRFLDEASSPGDLEVVTRRKYPCDPDTGRRGFCSKDYEGAPADTVRAITDELVERMREWLELVADDGAEGDDL